MENVVLINSALEEPVSFTRQKNFTIIFGMPDKNPANRTDALSPDIFSDKKIYYTRHVNGVDLFFRFDKNVSNSKDSAIRFDYRRTRYIPLQKQL